MKAKSIVKEVTGLVAGILILYAMFIWGSIAWAEELEATWTEPSANADGTRFYRVQCSNPFTVSPSGIVSCEPPGFITPTLVQERDRNPGATDCARAWPDNTRTSCYGANITAEVGEQCYATTAYMFTGEESEYGPIICLNVGEAPEPVTPPTEVIIKLICADPQNCTVEIIQ